MEEAERREQLKLERQAKRDKEAAERQAKRDDAQKIAMQEIAEAHDAQVRTVPSNVLVITCSSGGVFTVLP